MDAVRNAADREQVKAADKAVKQRRRQDLLDLREVLRLPAGRRVLWRWIDRLRPVDRLWDAGALIHYKTGFHDVAVMMLNEINEADPDALVLMMTEARERAKAEEAIAQRPSKKEDKDE